MGFYLYKGLKKPLVFYGLKGKFIYYAVGVIISGFIMSGILSSFLNFFGTFIGFAFIGAGIWYIFKIQDTKGLYNKTKNNNEVYIFPKNLNFKKTETPKEG